MKILRIRFENINSLKGLHEIDFTINPLASSGLFAITGPTGSGKSTILDVITLALYNRIPRISEKISKTVIDKAGLILTRNMAGCFAEVTYESNAGIFTSKWSIDRARTGNLRDYEMIVADKGNNILPFKKADVPEKNAELIGLNFDQFVKAIVLAQGDFAAFLKAKGGEREKLLEQVTGSWIYRALGKAAFNKNKEFGRELERLTLEEQHHKSMMLDENAYAELTKNLKSCVEEITNAGNDISKLNSEKKLKQDIANLGLVITSQEKKESEIVADQKLFHNKHGVALEKHRKLIPFHKRLWEWQQLEKLTESDAKRLIDKKQESKACLEKRKTLKNEVKILTGSDDEIQKALSDFENIVLAIEKEKSEKDTTLRGRKEEALTLANDISLEIDYNNTNEVIKILESAIAENKTIISSLTDKLGKDIASRPDEELKKLKMLLAEAHSYKSAKTLLDDKIKSISDENRAAENTRDEIALMPGIIETSKVKNTTSLLVFDNLSKEGKIRDLTASLENQRGKLNENEPCPLCGSLSHPYADYLPEFSDDLDERIQNAKKQSEKDNSELIRLETSFSQKGEDLKKLEQRIGTLQKESGTLRISCDEVLKNIPAEYRALSPLEIINNVTLAISDLENLVLENNRKIKLSDLLTKTKSIIGLFNESSVLATKREMLFKGDNVRTETSRYLNMHSANVTLEARLLIEEKELEENIDKGSLTLKSDEKKLLKELKDYLSLKDALNDIIDSVVYQKLNSEDTKFNEDLNTIRPLLYENRKALIELKKQDTLKEIQEIDTEIEAIKKTIVEKNLVRDSLVTTKSVHDKAIESLAALSEEINAQKTKNEKWMLLDKYIGDAEGKRFSVFAQQLTLFQLVKLANKRLLVLSDRYLLSIPEEGEDDSLAIQDRHMGDLRRSVKSLSGGESFLVSLSLALALSDLASRQVEIKSLFIDEGFGALDKLTLDQTIDTLERLQSETNKTIGVISHIEAMQERITTQIQLTRNGQGYSTVEIIG